MKAFGLKLRQKKPCKISLSLRKLEDNGDETTTATNTMNKQDIFSSFDDVVVGFAENG